MHYAAFNTYADLSRGDHGFANSWVIVRFVTKAEREEFLVAFDDKKAKAVTRKEAECIHERNYTSVGEKPPVGGLFNGRTFWGQGFMGVEWEEVKFSRQAA